MASTAKNHENIIDTSPTSSYKAEVMSQSTTLKQEHLLSLIQEQNTNSDYKVCSTNSEILNDNYRDENSTKENSERNICTSNLNIELLSSTVSYNAVEKDVVFPPQQHKNRKQLDQRTRTNLNTEQSHSKFETVEDWATFLFFILYLMDIYSDMSLAFYFFSIGKFEYGLMILYPIYVCSLFTTIFEWSTHETKNLKYIGLTVVNFIFNLSGVMVYKDIIVLLLRKLKKKPYDKILLNSKQQTMKLLKGSEAFLEAIPQLGIQSNIISRSILANEHVTWLQYVSVVTSGLGIIASIAAFLVSWTRIVPNISVFGRVIKWIWLIFDTGLFYTLFLINIMVFSVIRENNYTSLLFIFILICFFFLFNICFTYFDIIDSFNMPFISIVLLPVFINYSTYFTFELKCLYPRKAIIARLLLITTTIFTTIGWYYAGNNILLCKPFLYDLIYYISTVSCVLGLTLIILIVVQISRVPLIKRRENIVNNFFSY